MYLIQDLFGFLVIVSVNVTNHVLLENIYIMKSSADKSVEECTENIDEVKLLEWIYLSIEIGVYVLTQFVLP